MSNAANYTQESDVINPRILATWPGAATTIAWEGKSFKPTPGTAWIRPTIHGVDATQAGLGTGDSGRLFRHTGLLVIELFYPMGKGSGPALALADTLAAAFRETVSGIRFYAPVVKKQGASGSWFKVNVECPFQRDSLF